MVVHELLNN